MDVKEINSYGQEMIECLKLKTSPVAVKLIPTGGEIPDGIKKVDEAMRHCQLVDRVRRTGEEFYTLGEDQMCKGGAGAMGIGEMPAKVASGEFYYKGLKQFSTQSAARRTIEMVPKLPPNSTEAVLYAPLEKPHLLRMLLWLSATQGKLCYLHRLLCTRPEADLKPVSQENRACALTAL